MHGYGGRSDGTIVIVFTYNKNSITIELCDWGRRFTPPELIEKKPKFKLDQWEIGGFGLILMNEFMDELRFSHDEKLKRNNLVMKKYFD
jgi:anti-sigma regulatory factor (Ser/Thr protein kinase)